MMFRMFLMALLAGSFYGAHAQDAADRELQLHLEKNGLAAVKLALFDTSKSRFRQQSPTLTDMWLRMSVAKGTVEEALKRPNSSSIDRTDQQITIELLSVVAGQLHSDTKGYCSGWSNDVAWCTYGCDGQGFQLKRLTTEYPVKVRILVSAKLPKDNAAQGMLTVRPLSITLCGADDNGDEMMLVPRKGDVAEIGLTNE